MSSCGCKSPPSQQKHQEGPPIMNSVTPSLDHEDPIAQQQQQQQQTHMNQTTNVLVQYTLQDLAHRAETNFWLGLICLAVCAVNMVLLGLNYAMNHRSPPPDVAERTFHLLEFWTSHVYAIAEALALVTSPKTDVYSKPNLLKLLLFFNVVNSLAPALLITLDTEYFEKIAHELEFINSFSLSFITLILLESLLKAPPMSITDLDFADQESTSAFLFSIRNKIHQQQQQTRDISSLVMGLLACAVAATTFWLYNFVNEESAHTLEFSFNVVTSLVTFWFCMDNRFVAQMEIGQILYGSHQNCNLCQKRTIDFVVKSRYSCRWRLLYGGKSNNNNNNDNNFNDSNNQIASDTKTASDMGTINEMTSLLF